MEPLHIQSEEAFYFYIKKFLKNKPDAVQLDGSSKKKENKKVILIFTYSVNGNEAEFSGWASNPNRVGDEVLYWTGIGGAHSAVVDRAIERATEKVPA